MIHPSNNCLLYLSICGAVVALPSHSSMSSGPILSAVSCLYGQSNALSVHMGSFWILRFSYRLKDMQAGWSKLPLDVDVRLRGPASYPGWILLHHI